MSHTETFTNQSFDWAEAIVDAVNTASASTTVKVNGREVFKGWGQPAKQWNNGTVEVWVKPVGNGSRPGSVWVKRSQSVAVEVL